MEKAQDNRQVATEALGEWWRPPPASVLYIAPLLCCVQPNCLINKTVQLVVQPARCLM